MEEEFLNLGLDIIGLGVFNYSFGSITRESPVIKVCFPLIHSGVAIVGPRAAPVLSCVVQGQEILLLM